MYAFKSVLLIWLFIISAGVQAAEQQRVHFGQMANELISPIPPYLWFDHCQNKRMGAINVLIRRAINDSGYLAESVDIHLPNGGYQDIQKHKLNLLKSGKIDVIVTYVRDHEASNLHFGHEKIFELLTSIVTLKSENTPTQMSELKGLKGATPTSSSSATFTGLKTMGLDMRSVTSSKEGMELLKAGNIDYLLTDRFIARSLAIDLNMYDQLKITSLPKGRRDFYFAAAKTPKGIEIIKRLDKQLAVYKDNGYLHHLNKSHLHHWLKDRNCQALRASSS